MNNPKIQDRRYELLWKLLRKQILERSFVEKKASEDVFDESDAMDNTRPGNRKP